MSASLNWVAPMAEFSWAERIDELRQQHLPQIMDVLDSTVLSGSPDGSSLVEMTRYHLETGGKRLRAVLPLAVADALGSDPKNVVAFGAACEILHNATLVHDDLQDGDRIRRGAETIWVKYGEARAINLGDAMLYYTLMLVRKVPGSADLRESLSDRVLKETVRVIDGQEREFLLQQDDVPTWADYVKMVEGKTSGLFALPLAGAAEIAGASSQLVDGMTRAAGHLGVIFQIQDDVLDIFGQKGRERPGSDIAEGKISALVIHTLENASPEDSAWLRDLLRRERELVTDADIQRATQLFLTTGALDFTLAEIDRRANLALSEPALDEAPQLKALVSAIVDLFLAPIAELKHSREHG